MNGFKLGTCSITMAAFFNCGLFNCGLTFQFVYNKEAYKTAVLLMLFNLARVYFKSPHVIKESCLLEKLSAK